VCRNCLPCCHARTTLGGIDAGDNTPSVAERLVELHALVVRVLNNDLMNLRIAIFALAERLNATGPTDDERQRWGEDVMAWIALHGHDSMSEHLVIGMWSALEVYVEDVFILYCSTASLTPEQLTNVNVKAAELTLPNDEERWRIVWKRADQANRGSPVDRWDAIFGKLGISIGFEVLRVPGSEYILMDGKTVRVTLRELAAVRNVLVHRSGIADQRLVQVAGDRYRLGERIVLTDDAVLVYGNAIHNYAPALAAAVETDIEID
jgi:hypothetical protein